MYIYIYTLRYSYSHSSSCRYGLAYLPSHQTPHRSPDLQGGVAGAEQQLLGFRHPLAARVDRQHQLRHLDPGRGRPGEPWESGRKTKTRFWNEKIETSELIFQRYRLFGVRIDR